MAVETIGHRNSPPASCGLTTTAACRAGH